MPPGDLAGGFSDLEMTWLLYCTGAVSDHGSICSLVTTAGHLVKYKYDIFSICVVKKTPENVVKIYNCSQSDWRDVVQCIALATFFFFF